MLSREPMFNPVNLICCYFICLSLCCELRIGRCWMLIYLVNMRSKPACAFAIWCSVTRWHNSPGRRLIWQENNWGRGRQGAKEPSMLLLKRWKTLTRNKQQATKSIWDLWLGPNFRTLKPNQREGFVNVMTNIALLGDGWGVWWVDRKYWAAAQVLYQPFFKPLSGGPFVCCIFAW